MSVLSIASALTACNIAPVSPIATTRAQLQMDGDAQAIIRQQPVRFAKAKPGDEYATFQPGIYTQTKEEVIFSRYSEHLKVFQKILILPVSQIDRAAIESWGIFNGLKQLQLKTGDYIIVVNFTGSASASAGTIEQTKPPYDALLSVGVKAGEPHGRILPSDARNFVVPIIVPRK